MSSGGGVPPLPPRFRRHCTAANAIQLTEGKRHLRSTMATALEKSLKNMRLLNDSLRSTLECPVCFEFCETPIYMCSNGHNICHKCQPSQTQCPTCRVDGKPTARCFPLEKMADKLKTTPCANEREGCEAVLNAVEMVQHWETCKEEYKYKCFTCGDDRWSGDRNTLVAHVKEKHRSYSEDDVVQLNIPDANCISKNASWSRFISAQHGELFWIVFQYHHDIQTARIYSMFIGKKENATKYRGKVVYSSPDGIESTNLVNVNCLRTLTDPIPPGVVRLHKTTLEEYMSEGSFRFTMQILKR